MPYRCAVNRQSFNRPTPSHRLKAFGVLAVVAVVVVAVAIFPMPSPMKLRDWASASGSAAAFLFLLVYSAACILPLPRTAFNLAAGLLLGPTVGIAIAIAATTISAGLSFTLARDCARNWAYRQLHRGAARKVHDRLSQGGVLTIASLRLIPLMPFAPLSYCCGISSLKTMPYLIGSTLGSLPSTIAVVLLGDAIAGKTSPGLLVCYVIFTLVGVLGLTVVARRNTVRETTLADSTPADTEKVLPTNVIIEKTESPTPISA